VKIVLAVGLLWAGVALAQEPPKTSVDLIVDVSKSFAPLGNDHRQTLERVGDEVTIMAQQQWEKPIKLSWSVIGSDSLSSKPPCPAATYNERLIAGNAPKGELTRRDLVKAWMNECLQQVIARSKNPENYTDISGAIALSTYNRSPAVNKMVIIYSDFVEDLRPGTEVAHFNLSGEHFILLARPEAGDSKNLNSLFQRLEAWERRLKSAGASTVCRMVDINLSEGAFAGCFQTEKTQ
jgi:hypothetical protein